MLGVVAHHEPPVRSREMLEEQLPLKADGPMQRDVAVLLFERGDPALELLLTRAPRARVR